MSATRSVTSSLLSIVLGLEGVVLFFVALAAFGLKRLDPATAFIGGAALMLIYFLAAGLVRRAQWAQWLGWVLQIVLLATGFVLTPMFVIGALFVGLWVWCWIRGHGIDRAKAAQPTPDPQPQGESP